MSDRTEDSNTFEVRNENNQTYTIVENYVFDTVMDGWSKLTLMTLMRFAIKRKDLAFPSFKILMDRVGCKTDRLIKSLDDLVNMGLIEIKKRKGEGNLYIIKNFQELAMEGKFKVKETNKSGKLKLYEITGHEILVEPDAGAPPELEVISTQEFEKLPKEAVELSLHLIDKINQNFDRQPTPDKTIDDRNRKLLKWCREMDRLNRIGPPGGNKGFTWEEIRKILDWSQDHGFWKGNILSATKLREKVMTIIGQMQRGNNKPQFQGSRANLSQEILDVGKQLQAELETEGGW